jgi:hypothetical protein
VDPEVVTTEIETEEQELQAPKRRERAADPIWDTLMEVCDIDTTNGIPKSARGAYNRAVSELRGMRPPVTPDEIRARANRYRAQWDGATLTPTALARRWLECSPSTQLVSTSQPKRGATANTVDDVQAWLASTGESR